jgi:isopentenyl diphosphate isomerase/L-lactate dehydrogenase-like FMN-dependent dehydrogenase
MYAVYVVQNLVHSMNFELWNRLNKVSEVSTATSLLCQPTSLPIFIAPAALARLGHPDGEVNLVRAAGKEDILQVVSISMR